MWTTPSVVSILARWLPSSTSSTISGWSLRIARRPPWTCSGDGADEVDPDTPRSGAPHRSGSAVSAASSVQSLPAPSTMAVTRRRPGPMPSVAGTRRASPSRSMCAPGVAPPAAPARAHGGAGRSSSSGAGVGRSDAIGSRLRVGRGPPGSPVRIRARPTALRRSRQPPAATAAQDQPRRHGQRHHPRGDHEQSDHDPCGFARRPLSSASTTSGSLSGRSRRASGMYAW